MRNPGTKWASLALPKDLMDRIHAAAGEKGTSAAYLARQILETHFPPQK